MSTQVPYTLPISWWASFKFSSLTQQNGEPRFMPTLHDLEISFPFQSYLFGFEDMMLFLVRIHTVPCPVPQSMSLEPPKCFKCVPSSSAVSDFLRPHELQPSRFPCPWQFLGKNNEVSCYFLLHGNFPTQGLNLHPLCLLHRRQILYLLSHWGSRMSQSCGLVDTSEVEEPEHGLGSARSLSFLERNTCFREEHGVKVQDSVQTSPG